MISKGRSYTKQYIVFTYLLFWCSIGLVAVGFVASGLNPNVMNWGSIPSSWTPTIVLLLMFKSLFPGLTIREWLKRSFSARVNVGLMISATAALSATAVAMICIVAARSNQPVMSVVRFSFPAVASTLFFSLVQGATGEEAGWRGYLQPIMEKKAGGVIAGSVLVGLVWSFWHTPLWFASGATGWNLAIYIATFIASNLSLAVVIGVCFSNSRNLAVPMWIHFVSNALNNTLGVSFAGDPIEARCWLALFYVITAVGFARWHRFHLGELPQ